jgi:excisionase family DNA binding protein
MRFTSAELTEIRRLFRAKLRYLREQERGLVQQQRAREVRHRQSQRSAPSLIADESLPTEDALLSPGEVARLFGISPKTVARWADTGVLMSFRTLGGQRRFRWADVKRSVNRAGAANP